MKTNDNQRRTALQWFDCPDGKRAIFFTETVHRHSIRYEPDNPQALVSHLATLANCPGNGFSFYDASRVLALAQHASQQGVKRF